MTDTDENITIINENTKKLKKDKKKRTYEQQKERIKAYLKNRYENDEEFRTKSNNRRLINSNLKYNTDEEYRLKKLEYLRQNRINKIVKKETETETDNIEEETKKLNDMLKNMSTGKVSLDDVAYTKRLYEKLMKMN
tara:strand:+ start:1678 stop:2088 length:411 start_codon:yes stop_codon:yes gene_type:complete